jgi:hypothetical protein
MCVQAMETVERRVAPPRDAPMGPRCPARESLGALPAAVVSEGLLRAVTRFVLPRLGRMGILPNAGA